jgi:hypothetical protein
MKHLNIGGYHVICSLSRLERYEFLDLLKDEFKKREEQLKKS